MNLFTRIALLFFTWLLFILTFVFPLNQSIGQCFLVPISLEDQGSQCHLNIRLKKEIGVSNPITRFTKQAGAQTTAVGQVIVQ
jgi:hypothetical protein